MLFLRLALDNGEIFLFNRPFLKLFLQLMVGFRRLCHQQDTRRHHIQPMHEHRTRPSRLSPRGHRIVADLPWHTQHPRRLVDHGHHRVFPNDTGLKMLEPSHFGIRVDVKTLQHPREHRLTLATAGRIELSMMTNLTLRRFTPPELRHTNGLQTMLIGILQQLRGTTVTRTTGRQRIFLTNTRRTVIVLPDLYQILLLTTGIQHPILSE